MATDEAMLLQMQKTNINKCAVADSDDDQQKDDLGNPKIKQMFKDLAEQEQIERKPINGDFYDVRIKTHYFGGQRQVVFVFTNVSAEKELQRELVMKEYSQIMFTSINHELRTPINAIQNSLQILKPFLSQLGMQYYEICKSSSEFLLSLVNDTLDFAQLQAGKFKMNYENVNLRDLMQEVCSLINVQLRLKESVYLVDSVAQDVPETIETDC